MFNESPNPHHDWSVLKKPIMIHLLVGLRNDLFHIQWIPNRRARVNTMALAKLLSHVPRHGNGFMSERIVRPDELRQNSTSACETRVYQVMFDED